jgi:hypothetical protein
MKLSSVSFKMKKNYKNIYVQYLKRSNFLVNRIVVLYFKYWPDVLR